MVTCGLVTKVFKMPILFSAVAQNKTVLAKYACCEGNFTEILEEVLSKIPPRNEKMTYSHGRYLLNYICHQNGYFYFCITDKTCQRSRAFLFLNEIARRFRPRHRGFHQVLAEEMRRFSEDYSTVAIRKGELDELNNIGVGSSETILGGKILFVKNSETLEFSKLSYVGEAPQQITFEGDKYKYSLNFYIVVLAVILGVSWWVSSKIGITSFVIMVCVCAILFVRLSKIIKVKF